MMKMAVVAWEGPVVSDEVGLVVGLFEERRRGHGMEGETNSISCHR